MTLLVFERQNSWDTFDCISVLLFVVVLTRCAENKEATAISSTSNTCAATLEVVQSLLCIVTERAFYRPTSCNISVGSILLAVYTASQRVDVLGLLITCLLLRK